MSTEDLSVVTIRVLAITVFIFTVSLSALSFGITYFSVPDEFSFHDSYFIVANGAVEAAASLITSVLLYAVSKPIARIIGKGI